MRIICLRLLLQTSLAPRKSRIGTHALQINLAGFCDILNSHRLLPFSNSLLGKNNDYSVFEINGAPGARCARFRHWAHDFRHCVPDVCTFLQPIMIFSVSCNTNTLGSALGKSRAHTLISCAPERRTNNYLNFKQCYLLSF